MRGVTKFLSILIAVIMLVQMIPMVAMAANTAPYELDWDAEDAGTIFFRPADDIDSYYIRMYKDGEEIDGTWCFTNEKNHLYGVTYEFFKFDLVDNGAGEYYFTVSTVTDDLTINDDAVRSEPYIYNPPTQKAGKPYSVQVTASGDLTWKCEDASIENFVLFYTFTYDNKDYYELAFEEVNGNEWTIDPDDVELYYDHIDSWDSEEYPKEYAKFAIFVYSVPEDRDVAEIAKSDVCIWADVSSDLILPDEGEDENPDDGEDVLDRTTVDEKYYDGAKVVYDLGIMPLVYTQPTETITKGEFAIVLTAMLGGKEAAAAMQNILYFPDVTVGTELNGCVNYVRSMGVITGNTDGTFGVDEEVAYEDAVTALVRALGYEPYAQTAGGYSAGYLTVARRYGISDGVSLAIGTPVKTQELAQLVANSLEIGKPVPGSFNTNGTTSPVISKKTLLNDNLGFTLAYGDLTVNEDTAIIDGRVFDKESLNGRFQKYDDLVIQDSDVKALDGKDVKLYVKDGIVYCGFEYYGGEVIINNGEETTKSNVVDVQVILYSYTKYKHGDIEYKPASDNTFTYTFSNVDGKKTLRVTLASDDESKTESISGEITYDNKRTITYMANGEVYKTVTVGVGKSFTTPYPRDIVGYKFNKWIGVPADNIMPDKDITITADLTKLTKVTAKLMYNGEPLYWVEITDQQSGGAGATILPQPDEDGNFEAYLEPGERMLKFRGQYYSSINVTMPLVVGKKDIDLGTIEFDKTYANARIDISTVKTVAIPDKVFTAEDEEYAKASTNNNVEVRVVVTNSSSSDQSSIKAVLAEQYAEYKSAVVMPKITVSKVKTGTTSSTETMAELPALITVKMEIEEDLLHKGDFVVVREHEGAYDALTTTPNADGEYIEIDGRFVYIHAKKFSTYGLAGNGFRFVNAIGKGFGMEDKSLAEVTLGSDNGNKIINIADTPMFYSPQRGMYVALVDTSVIGSGNAVADYQITDGEPETFVYGNVNEDDKNVVNPIDLQVMKLFMKGKKSLSDLALISSDVTGDGKLNAIDVQQLKLNLKNNYVFGILK